MVSTTLDPRFKDIRCLPRAKRAEVWQKLSEILKDREPTPQASREDVKLEPPKKMVLLLMGSESESDNEALSTYKTLGRYKAEPCVSIDTCPL